MNELKINEAMEETEVNPAEDLGAEISEISEVELETPPAEAAAQTALATPPPEPRPAYKPPPPAASRPKERMSFKSVALLVALGAVLAGFSAGAGIGLMVGLTQFIVATTIAPVELVPPPEQVTEVLATIGVQPSISPSLGENMPGSFNEIIRAVKPSIVNISAVMGRNQSFFNMPETPKGSGVIFKEDDEKVYIITNHHVVSGAQSVSVSIDGGASVNAGLVGRESQADIAVIYVLKEDLAEAGIHNVTLARLGNSDMMQTGDIVLAIGNAMGEGNTVTQGIISVMSKDIRVEGRVLSVIQTDAAINPGNSGGALVNMRGEVIGINTAKTISSPLNAWFDGMGGAVEGMGYSIATNVVIPVVEEIMLMIPRPFLGIRGETVSREIASLYSIPELGVLIEEVIPNTAADAAGLQRTDIITAFNDSPIFSMPDLQTAIRESAVGDLVEIRILRDGRTQMTVRARLLASEDGEF